MNKTFKKTILALAISSMGIASAISMGACDTKKSNVNSLKSALLHMATKDNFTLSVGIGSSLPVQDITYTKDSMGVSSTDVYDITNVYYSDTNGTYQINYDGFMYKGSEYRSDKNVWDSHLFPTFQGISTKFIETIDNTTTDVSIKDKSFRIAFMEVLGFGSSAMVDIDSLTASYSDKTIKFVVRYLKETFTLVAHDFDTSVDPVVNEYVVKKKKGAYRIKDDQKMARDGFLTNNFEQLVYMFGEDADFYSMKYYFSPKYFIQQSITATEYVSGYISLHCPEVLDGDNPHPALKGLYTFTMTKTSVSLNPRPITDDEDIVRAMNYPSCLSLFNNYHLFQEYNNEVDGVTTEGYGYYIDNRSLINNFSKNFDMDTAFSGQKPMSIVMDIVTENDDLIGVKFYYQFRYENRIYTYPIPFGNFGKVKDATLDMIYDTYHTL